MHKQAQTH